MSGVRTKPIATSVSALMRQAGIDCMIVNKRSYVQLIVKESDADKAIEQLNSSHISGETWGVYTWMHVDNFRTIFYRPHRNGVFYNL